MTDSSVPLSSARGGAGVLLSAEFMPPTLCSLSICVKVLRMNAQQLPIPNPEDWVTVDGACKILGRSKHQVIRYLADQRIRSYRIYGSRDRLAERLIWRHELLEFKAAQAKVRRPGVVEQVRRRAEASRA